MSCAEPAASILRPICSILPIVLLFCYASASGSRDSIKPAFHDADTDTDILARILADTSDTRDFLKLFLVFPGQAERHAGILATILARMSVSVSWNEGLTQLTPYGAFAHIANSMYFNRGVHTLSYQRRPSQPIPAQRVCECTTIVSGEFISLISLHLTLSHLIWPHFILTECAVIGRTQPQRTGSRAGKRLTSPANPVRRGCDQSQLACPVHTK